MKPSKIQKTPKYAKGIAHACDLLREIGVECDASRMKKILRENPKAQDDHGRITMALVTKAIEAEPPATGDDKLESKDVLERRKIREQYLRAKSAREREDRLLFHRDDLQREGVRTGTALAALLDAFESEIPHWVGMSQAEASQKAKAHSAEIRALFAAESEKLWGKA